MRGDFPWKRVPGYVIAQVAGSILAVLFLRATLGNIGGLGPTEPGPGLSATTALVFAAVLTLGLLSTLLGTASIGRASCRDSVCQSVSLSVIAVSLNKQNI